ncbi:MAG: sodium:solute symporter family transporter, partial [Planctomycetota bacterium]
MFGLYAVLVFALAGFAQRLLARRTFLGEYFLGSRGLGTLGLALTFTATSASAGSFVGFPSLIYAHGWVLALWISSYMVFGLCAMGLLGKRLNRVARISGAITLPDVLRARFGRRGLAMTATSLIALLLSLYLIPQFKVGAQILHTLLSDVQVYRDTATGLGVLVKDLPYVGTVDSEYLLCLLTFSVLVILYTAFGGFRAVVWTDILQGFVMVFGVAAMLVLALWQVGGLDVATEKMAKMTPPRLGQVVFEMETPAEQTVRIESERWVDVAGEDGVALVRINETALIAKGETSSVRIEGDSEVGTKAVQITTPSEIESIRAGFVGGRPPALPENVSVRV